MKTSSVQTIHLYSRIRIGRTQKYSNNIHNRNTFVNNIKLNHMLQTYKRKAKSDR